MSYDLYLCDPITDETLELDTPHHMRGGTYCVGGESRAKLNITFNYTPHFAKVLGEGGIKKLEGMTGADSIPFLQAGIEKLGDDVDPDYWKATEGNAKASLLQLVALARMRPDGVWRISY